MGEAQRFQFLIDRDGLESAIEWERNTAMIYFRASEKASQPRQDNESLNVARGKEWAEKFTLASNECLSVIKPYATHN